MDKTLNRRHYSASCHYRRCEQSTDGLDVDKTKTKIKTRKKTVSRQSLGKTLN